MHDTDARLLTTHHTYGAAGFVMALRTCTVTVRGQITSADQQHLDALAQPPRQRHATPLPGVRDTLSEL